MDDKYFDWYMNHIKMLVRTNPNRYKFRFNIILREDRKHLKFAYVLDEYEEGTIIRIWLGIIFIKITIPNRTWQYKIFHKKI